MQGVKERTHLTESMSTYQPGSHKKEFGEERKRGGGGERELRTERTQKRTKGGGCSILLSVPVLTSVHYPSLRPVWRSGSVAGEKMHVTKKNVRLTFTMAMVLVSLFTIPTMQFWCYVQLWS